METMRAKAKNKYIWVDETTESDQRIIANFIFGLMEINENSIERGKCYLLNIAVFYKANANSVSKSSILYRYYIQKVKSVHKRKKNIGFDLKLILILQDWNTIKYFWLQRMRHPICLVQCEH